MRIVLFPRAVADLQADPDVLHGTAEIADSVAAEMRRRAPRDTGRGAESIHAEPAPDPRDGFRVSWDEAHFYLSFHEYGTQRLAARPFARPTADEFNRR